MPVSHTGLAQAILLNGVAVEKNRLAFAIGRVLAHQPDRFADGGEAETETLDQIIARRALFLNDYQNARYAEDYSSRLDAIRRAHPTMGGKILESIARNLFRFMAYKDEFEVARLMTSPEFAQDLSERFEGDAKLSYHMAPPLLSWRKDGRGRPRKWEIGPWVRPALGVLSRLRTLRGTALNPFGYHAEARLHRDLLAWYQSLLDRLIAGYDQATDTVWSDILACADEVRGYGPVRVQAANSARNKVEKLLQSVTSQAT